MLLAAYQCAINSKTCELKRKSMQYRNVNKFSDDSGLSDKCGYSQIHPRILNFLVVAAVEPAVLVVRREGGEGFTSIKSLNLECNRTSCCGGLEWASLPTGVPSCCQPTRPL